jgi:hypothetical protein
MKEKLKAILEKIQKNQIDAWEDGLEETRSVVILEDFDRGDDIPFIVKYNGWLEDLEKIIENI